MDEDVIAGVSEQGPRRLQVQVRTDERARLRAGYSPTDLGGTINLLATPASLLRHELCARAANDRGTFPDVAITTIGPGLDAFIVIVIVILTVQTFQDASESSGGHPLLPD